mgnify:CR=1 FL=1
MKALSDRRFAITRRMFESGMAVPGATDAKHVTRLGTKVYGFSPLRNEPDVDHFALIHSHNERISVNNLLFSTQVIHDVVTRFAGA